MRAVLVLALLALLVGCGPLDATQSGGERADPGSLLLVLPSPGSLRGGPPTAADADALQRAFTGARDEALAASIAGRDPVAAGVREWSAADGGTLVAAVTVWGSHLTATQVGAELAARLVDDGGEGWTPTAVPGARGARVTDPARRELRLGYAIGPNALYVRATGPVSEETVSTALNRMIVSLRDTE